MEIAGWLERFFPQIEPVPWDEACWAAHLKTRSPEHHPPLYWLGRALDAVEAAGATEVLAQRLVAVHGAGACEGWGEADERLQDVFTEACAFAWAAEHLGPPRFEVPGPEGAAGGALIHVPSRDTWLAPRRLWPVRTLQQLVGAIAEQAAEVSATLPEARGRVLYVDTYLNMRMYAQDVGYRIDITEPVRTAVRHYAHEHGLGYALTRPFQWGNALEAWY